MAIRTEMTPAGNSRFAKAGELIGQFDDKSEGIIIFDTETENIDKRILAYD